MNLPVEYAISHFFPATSFDLIYSEAVANAFDAEASEISIDIDLKAYSKPKTLKLIIRDNGVGFNDDNFDRFSNLMKVKDAQHKGLGRLVYLQYFTSVTVNSVFGNGQRRTFSFEDSIKDLKEESGIVKDSPFSTELYFSLEFTHFSSEEELLTLKTKGEVRFWKWFWAFSVRTALAVVKVEQCCETRQ